MSDQNIIVVGASAGGFEALKTLIGGLPADLPASVFIVWHMAPDIRGILPQVLDRFHRLPVAHAYDGQPIERGHVYVAPPDRHLLIEDGRMLLTRGPKENRFRPAVDPLFRSAAYCHGPNVTGIILSGALDDGTSGLWTVKNQGGTAIVQDPKDAEISSMPENAIREVKVDYIVPVAEMPELIVRLLTEREGLRDRQEEGQRGRDAELSKQLATEISIAAEDDALALTVMQFGDLTPYTCPDCHGVLSMLREGGRMRFRCHTGHAFTPDVLLAAVTENIETSVWNAIRGVDESIMLLDHLGDHFAEENEPKLAALYFKKANDAKARNQLLRDAVFSHEQLNADSLRHAVEDENGEGAHRPEPGT